MQCPDCASKRTCEDCGKEFNPQQKEPRSTWPALAGGVGKLVVFCPDHPNSTCNCMGEIKHVLTDK